ncbi:hypothetical protein SAMN03159422_05210 [Agrobacterium fabrum]|jgi:hypothetical protein|nr:hypothetical protein SAMN03159422_05210 [Agrobacterium fabrum]SES22966.1 hypothetical protein SAMN03159504_05203 [Agrobacterium fabrum]
MEQKIKPVRHVVGGVDTHKDLHVAAVVVITTAFLRHEVSRRPATAIG